MSCRGAFLTDVAGLSSQVVIAERVVVSVGVESGASDELTVDECVSGRVVDDGDGWLTGVFGSQRDPGLVASSDSSLSVSGAFVNC